MKRKGDSELKPAESEEIRICRMAVEARLQEMGVEVVDAWGVGEQGRYTVVFKLNEQFALYYSSIYWEEDLDLEYLINCKEWFLLDNEVAVREFDRIMDESLPVIDRPVKVQGSMLELIKRYKGLCLELHAS
jgi:hypothetical protein